MIVSFLRNKAKGNLTLGMICILWIYSRQYNIISFLGLSSYQRRGEEEEEKNRISYDGDSSRKRKKEKTYTACLIMHMSLLHDISLFSKRVIQSTLLMVLFID